MKLLYTLIFFSFFLSCIHAQEKTLKEQAVDEFKKEHYDEAIALLEKAELESPDDAEIYFYLGWFNHYRAYDSRPLQGYDFEYSKKIFAYMDKAISLNPKYGNAKYFYGAECSANAFNAMYDYDLKKLKYFYKQAYEKGAYPAWLIEFGKNMMNTCDRNAILFTGGNADFDICMYLQLHQRHRTDLTVVSLGYIERPWYVTFLKNGLEGGVKKINIALDDRQIMDIHPFKWDTTEVYINVSEKMKNEFQLAADYKMKWRVEPDLLSNRMHSKIESEQARKRIYLSPLRAILLHIIENNFGERPVYFTNFAESTFYGGLNAYFRNCGLTSQLTPVKTVNTDNSGDVSKLELLFKAENFKDLPNLKSNDIPRISGIIFAYHIAAMQLARTYKQYGQIAKLKKLIEIYKSNIAIGIDKEYEDEILNEMEIMPAD
ncbi:MAG: hypothetical protein LBP63_03230 [Prevotellaceae bacterium]|jgi:hypothetical protein|nr:hypothetical protein [Prevotellaceae bacterium]